MLVKLIFFFPLILFGYSVYSFAQTDPNLVISSQPYFWSFQQWMWQLGYHQRPLSTAIYIGLILLLFAGYGLILHLVSKNRLSKMMLTMLLVLSISALIPSYPALSHDVFNYLMNGKIVAYYQSTPYLHPAWDFPNEPWLAFMHNIEASTPYGYIWTGISALAYVVAFGDLQFGVLVFRMIGILAVLAIGWSIALVTKKGWKTAAWFLFNPLVLLEAVGNMHNDIVMMAFLMGGIALFCRLWPHKRFQAVATLLVMWLLSVYTKLVTVVAPVVFVGQRIVKSFIKIDWYGLLSLVFIGLMFFDGSRRFFSWYLLWAVSVAALTAQLQIKRLMLAFSLTGCLSYIFYFYEGNYSTEMLNYRFYFLFSLPILYTGWWIVKGHNLNE